MAVSPAAAGDGRGEVGGRLGAIWLKPAHRAAMQPAAEAELIAGRGLVGNVDRSRRRQVTLLEHEVWEHVTSTLGACLDASARRANLLVSGIRLARTTGAVLRIGASRLLIAGELTPCARMDAAFPGLREALSPEWRGGVFAQVLDGGTVRIGDAVTWESTTAAHGQD